MTGPATETEAQRSARLTSDQMVDMRALENLSTKTEIEERSNLLELLKPWPESSVRQRMYV